jgi:biotin synthase
MMRATAMVRMEEDKDLILFRKLGLNPEHTGTTAGDNEQQHQLSGR